MRCTSPPTALLRRAGVALALAIGLASGTVACADGEKADPAAERLERVRTRLEKTLTAAQARCVLDQVNTATLVELDRDGAITSSSPELSTYTDALAACVTEQATTSAPEAGGPTTTAAP